MVYFVKTLIFLTILFTFVSCAPHHDSGLFADGRHVPERKDDFAWENERVAFRVYGPALEADGQIGSGIDVWSKSTCDPVIDAWYSRGDYHTDHGDGGDFYHVGDSRGCGGSAVWYQNKMYPSRNWAKYSVLENTKRAVRFQLEYEPWVVGDRKVWETKTISLQAGSNLNRIETVLHSDQPGEMIVALGLVIRQGDGGQVLLNEAEGIMMYWEPINGDHGNTGCAVLVSPDDLVEMVETEGHVLALVKTLPAKPIVYYSGACWSKSDYFTKVEEWLMYLEEFSEKSANYH